MSRPVEKNEEYANSIYSAVLNLLDPDSEDHLYDVNTIDGTEFFVGMIKASALLFNKLAGEEKNFLEFTHLANQLIVQDMLKK